MKSLLLAGALLSLSCFIPAQAQIAPVTQNVGVCDPTQYVHNCIKPNADGSINADTSAGTPAGYASTATLAANLVVDSSPGLIYSFDVAADSTLSGAAWWVMIYDATSAPSDGTVTPKKCYAIPSGSTSIFAAFPSPVQFLTGITIGVSTTGCFTKTASTHAFISGDFK